MPGSNFSVVNGADSSSKVPISTPANDVNGNTVVGHLAMTPVSGVATPVSATNPLPVSDPALGILGDTPWSGSGGASVVATLKAIYLKLAATLSVTLSGSLPTGTNAIGSVSVSNLPATQQVSALGLPLPTGAATAARQPAIGVAGSPAADVLTVQGAPSMTALKVDGSAVTQPVSGTIAIAAAPIAWRFSNAPEAGRVLKPSAGLLYSVYVTTPSSGYLMLFDATTVPLDGAVTPVDAIQCGPSATTVLDYTATPLSFTNGIVAVFSSTGPFTKTASPVAFLKGGYV